MDKIYRVFYVTSTHSTTRIVKSSDSFDDLYKDLKKEFWTVAKTDDFWIDDISPSSNLAYPSIDWKDLLSDGYMLNKDILERLEEDSDIVFKYAFMLGLNTPLEDIEGDIIVLHSDDYSDYVVGNGEQYPVEWLQEQAKARYPELVKALDDAFAHCYFGDDGWCRVMADVEHNGNIRTRWFGDVFVCYEGRL